MVWSCKKNRQNIQRASELKFKGNRPFFSLSLSVWVIQRCNQYLKPAKNQGGRIVPRIKKTE
jgi:hypothetical protein